MPINTSKLIAAPMLQDVLIDKTGVVMAGGTITLFHDKNRTILKNWYYQSGTPTEYIYPALPNPLTLSAAGTITDINGVDTIPFFYPFLETDETMVDTYYIVINNAEETNQITRQNFPFTGAMSTTPTTITTFNNLIVNGGFWRNFAPNTLNITPFTAITLSSGGTSIFLTQQSVTIGTITSLFTGIVAPSQHDGFSFPDIQFIKDNLTSNDTCTFTPFPLATALLITEPEPTNSPEYYISYNSANAGSGETVKCFQFPIALHINNLANVNYTVTIQAQNVSGSPGGGALQLNILQFTGTGTTSPVPTVIQSTVIQTTGAWTQYSLTDVFPPTAGLTLGKGADDALYLQVQMPLNVATTMNFTKPSIYLTEAVVPEFDFQTYDQVDAVINSPRTGDVRTSLNSFMPFGWVPMNNGTIGNGATGATARANADTFPLYSLIWNAFNQFSTGTSASGANAIVPMFLGATQVGYGPSISTSAIADFNANKVLGLTQTLGRVIQGTVPISALLSFQSQTFTNAGNVITGSVGNFATFLGEPIQVSGGSLPSPLVSTSVYYAVPLSGNTLSLALSFANALTGTIIPLTTNGSGVISALPLGSQEGEYTHTLQLSEMVQHTHGPLAPNNAFIGNAAGTAIAGGTTVGLMATTGGISGYPIAGQTPFNVTQPSVFYNLFIKL